MYGNDGGGKRDKKEVLDATIDFVVIARMHEQLSKFNLTIHWRAEEHHEAADALSRWAYPAGCHEDVTIHGSAKDKAEAEARGMETEELLPFKDVERFPIHCKGCDCPHCKYRKVHNEAWEPPSCPLRLS